MKITSKLIALTSLGLATLLGGGCDNQKENTKMDTIYQFTTTPETIDAEIATLLTKQEK